jgi:S-methylmethionine-dependent homocysteine/selenocysteine methylase
MPTQQIALPQLGGRMFLTDGGIETTLIFHEGHDLPDFAAFHLLKSPRGVLALRQYFRTYAQLANRYRAGLILESATWRASSDWGARLGYSCEDLAAANRKAIEILSDIRAEFGSELTPIVISGCIGPRGDGYVPNRMMSPKGAELYHTEQIESFAQTEADLVTAITMNYVEEAIGIAGAARKVGLPAVISFTVETDGRLPTTQSLHSAIEEVDEATAGYPSYYMINCAHPTHFERVLTEGAWLGRIRGLRANASCKSHAELNECTTLDIGDPVELASQYARLKAKLPNLNVLGGCCGTDHRHVEEIAKACLPLYMAVA